MANEYIGRHVVFPSKEVGDVVEYVDREGRGQTGTVERIESYWSVRGREPLIVYTVSHPTYRGRRFYTTDESFR